MEPTKSGTYADTNTERFKQLGVAKPNATMDTEAKYVSIASLDIMSSHTHSVNGNGGQIM